MWIEVDHRLRFEYGAYIHESRMELRVRPRTSPHQSLRSFVLAVGPPTGVHRYADWNGNQIHHFAIHDFHERIEVLAQSLVNTHPKQPPIESLDEAPARPSPSDYDWLVFDGPVERSPALEDLDREVGVSSRAPISEQLAGLGRFILDRFEYQRGVSTFESTTRHLLEAGAGVCQDFAHLLLALLRNRGIPCRYVSGYLHLGGEKPAESHAWVELLAGRHGWVAFDPTHDLIPDDRYIVVGYGRNYHDVPPNRGVYRGNAEEALHAEVITREVAPRDLAQIHEQTARIDLPVYREVPVHRGDLPEEALAQQQQQQQ